MRLHPPRLEARQARARPAAARGGMRRVVDSQMCMLIGVSGEECSHSTRKSIDTISHL